MNPALLSHSIRIPIILIIHLIATHFSVEHLHIYGYLRAVQANAVCTRAAEPVDPAAAFPA